MMTHAFISRRLALAGLGSLLVLPLLAPAHAAPAKIPEADERAIRSFVVTNEVFTRMNALNEAARQMGLKRSGDLGSSLDEMAKHMLKLDARVPALLAKHGLTAREYIVASFALLRGVMASGMKIPADQAGVHPATLSFAASNPAKVQAFLTPPESESEDD